MQMDNKLVTLQNSELLDINGGMDPDVTGGIIKGFVAGVYLAHYGEQIMNLQDQAILSLRNYVQGIYERNFSNTPS